MVRPRTRNGACLSVTRHAVERGVRVARLERGTSAFRARRRRCPSSGRSTSPPQARRRWSAAERKLLSLTVVIGRTSVSMRSPSTSISIGRENARTHEDARARPGRPAAERLRAAGVEVTRYAPITRADVGRIFFGDDLLDLETQHARAARSRDTFRPARRRGRSRPCPCRRRCRRRPSSTRPDR